MSKRSATLLICFSVAFSLQAQVSKGGMLLGGGFSFFNSTTKGHFESTLGGGAFNNTNGPNRSEWSLQPTFSYLLNDQIGIGLAPGYSRSVSESTIFINTDINNSGNIARTETSSLYFIRPFVNYFMPFHESRMGFILHMYTHLGAGKVVIENEISSFVPDNDSSLSTFGFGIDPGLYFFVTPRIVTSISIGGINYSFTRVETEDESGGGNIEVDKYSTLNFFLSDRLAASMGISFYFGGQKD